MTKRTRHPEEFKREAVRLLEERGDRPVREIAEGLGVAESQLYDWRKKYGQLVEGRLNHRGESVEEEVRRLRQEVTQVTKERDLLKRTFALIVKDIK
jgi:transposase